jgi:hypothetical protein
MQPTLPDPPLTPPRRGTGGEVTHAKVGGPWVWWVCKCPNHIA